MSDRQGNARTRKDMQQWRLRDAARREQQARRDQIEAAGFNISRVVAVNPYGDVMIEALTARGDDGKWMSCLNAIVPNLGDYVYWTYAKGVPIVLGVMPKLENPYGFQTPNFRTYIDHFFLKHRGETSQAIGEFGWGLTVSTGFTFQHANPYLDYGTGWQRLHTSGVNGQHAVLTHPRNSLIIPSMTREIEFAFKVESITACGFYLGLSSVLHLNGEYLVFRFNTTSNDTQWMGVSKDAVKTVETGLSVTPAIGNRLVGNMRNVGDGIWNLSLRDYDTGENQGEAEFSNISLLGMYLYAGVYDRGGGSARILDLDYVAITPFPQKRGSLDVSIDP